MGEHRMRAHPHHYKKQLGGARGLIVQLMRERAEAEDIVSAAMYDLQMLQSVIAMREREIQAQAAQIAALKRMLAQARGETWTG